MTNEEIQKLLGGYATNSLTDAERKELFEAALDDQELFDALEREQALKDILDDPISRRQVRDALKTPIARAPSWWARWWIWSVAAGSLAAALTVGVLLKPDRTVTDRRSYDVAIAKKPVDTDALRDVQKAELKAPESTPPVPAPSMSRKKAALPPASPAFGAVGGVAGGGAAGVAASPPQVQETVQVTAQAVQVPQQRAPAGQSQVITDQEQLASALRKEEFGRQAPAASPRAALVTGYLGARADAKSPALIYSVFKLDRNGRYSQVAPNAPVQQGDAVRINVVPTIPGYLSLYEREPDGNLKRLFPLSGEGVKVTPSTTYTLPDTPIDVKDSEQLRLVLSPETTVEAAKPKFAEVQPQKDARSAPVVVDISLTGKNQ